MEEVRFLSCVTLSKHPEDIMDPGKSVKKIFFYFFNADLLKVFLELVTALLLFYVLVF